ncbi:three-Cys-motif partner protein TcmP [Streptomyces sp. NPDC006530]|uniref:three-Cys-motif partner protein TcmP n=1 Tax=Streptomyces sp. NPDC006530 TaxID=3364750 RepID=UPI0036AFFFF5
MTISSIYRQPGGSWGENIMAVGTTSGLLDHNHSQSVFKHAILHRYIGAYTAMVGSTSAGNRVAVVDGFAGRGRYPDGKPASGELILQAAARASRAIVEATLVEKNRADYAKLKNVVDEYVARGVHAVAHHGPVHTHLNNIVASAHGVPLFLFLDPCGAGLPFDDLSRVLAGERRPDRPSTEVLLNFNADFTRRATGALAASQHEHDSLPALDRVCGGTWWRDEALKVLGPDRNFERVAETIAHAYTKRLANSTGMQGITVPVKRRVSHQPVYHLVFLTRSPFGIWVFADALARARQEWLKALGPQEGDDENALFTFGDSVKDVIKQEQTKARERVGQNLRSIVARQSRMKLVDQVWSVFDGVYGIANDTTVSMALRLTVDEGTVRVIEEAKNIRGYVIGPGPQAIH